MTLVLDHIGIVVPSTESVASVLTKVSNFSASSQIVEDAYHGARIQFLSSPQQPFPRLELIEPLGGDSPLNEGLDRGGGVHHLCFQIAFVNTVEAWCKRVSIRKVYGPNPAPAFGDNRQVIFVYSPGLGLIEFVDTPGAQPIEDFNDISGTPMLKAFLDHKKRINKRTSLE